MALPAQSINRSFGAAVGEREIAYTLEHMWPSIVQSAFDTSVLSHIFFAEATDSQYGPGNLSGRGKSTQRGGIKVQARHEFGTSPNTKRMSGRWDTFNTAAADLVRWSETEWKYYSDAVTLSKQDMLENQGPDAIADLLMEQSRNCMSSLVTYTLQDAVSGSLATAFTGLDSIISANDSLQGLAGTAGNYGKWNAWGLSGKNTAPGSISFAGGSFSAGGLANMRDALVNCTYGTVKPHVIVTTEDIIQFYAATLAPNVQYAGPATSRGDSEFTNFGFAGIPVYSDVFATSGVIYFVNLDKTKCVFLEGGDFQAQDPVRAGNQEAITTEIIVRGNMMCLDRRYNNKITGVTA